MINLIHFYKLHNTKRMIRQMTKVHICQTKFYKNRNRNNLQAWENKYAIWQNKLRKI